MGEYFQKLIEHYASECTEERTIKLGIVSGAFTDVLIYPKTTDYTNIWNLISGNLIGASTGKVGKDEVDLSDYDRYLYIRRQNGVSYIDFMEDIGKASGQVIEFGKNLLDLSEYVDATNVYTQIIPLGKADSTLRMSTMAMRTTTTLRMRMAFVPISHPCIMDRIPRTAMGKERLSVRERNPMNDNCDGSGYDR